MYSVPRTDQNSGHIPARSQGHPLACLPAHTAQTRPQILVWCFAPGLCLPGLYPAAPAPAGFSVPVLYILPRISQACFPLTSARRSAAAPSDLRHDPGRYHFLPENLPDQSGLSTVLYFLNHSVLDDPLFSGLWHGLFRKPVPFFLPVYVLHRFHLIHKEVPQTKVRLFPAETPRFQDLSDTHIRFPYFLLPVPHPLCNGP